MNPEFFRKYSDLITESEQTAIDDEWFKQGSFKTFKNPAKERYEVAPQDGYIDPKDAKESKGKPVPYKKGWYIMTGPQGEKYAFPPEKFAELKDDEGHGICTPKKIIKIAKIADHSGSVDTSWGEKLYYDPGVDVIVRHGPGDYGVVKTDIFTQTYNVWGEANGV
jgi:hypothetical protein